MSTAPTIHDEEISSPELADLLEGYRDEIVASWVSLLVGMDDSYYLDRHWTHYRERSVEELQTAARACISALAPRRLAPWSEKFDSPVA